MEAENSQGFISPEEVFSPPSKEDLLAPPAPEILFCSPFSEEIYSSLSAKPAVTFSANDARQDKTDVPHNASTVISRPNANLRLNRLLQEVESAVQEELHC